jgi:hypothetical protein
LSLNSDVFNHSVHSGLFLATVVNLYMYGARLSLRPPWQRKGSRRKTLGDSWHRQSDFNKGGLRQGGGQCVA